MSILVPVSDLVERVRLDCGLPTFTTTTNITSAAVLDYIKRGAQKLAGLVQGNGASEHYFTLSTDLATVANVPVVSLPTNTSDVIRLAIVYDGDREVQLETARIDEWNPDADAWVTDVIPKFRVVGNTITLFPTPNAVRTIRCWYTVGFTVTSTSDILAMRSNWDEYIVAEACIMVRNRQEKSAAEFVDTRNMCRAEIISQLRRDRAGVRQVRDLRTNDVRWQRTRWPR